MPKLKNNGRRNSKLTEAQRRRRRQQTSERRQHLHPQKRQSKQQEKAVERTRRLENYEHQFDFELLQDGDRRPLLARHNLSERFVHS